VFERSKVPFEDCNLYSDVFSREDCENSLSGFIRSLKPLFGSGNREV